MIELKAFGVRAGDYKPVVLDDGIIDYIFPFGASLNCPDNILDLEYLGVYDLVENGTFSFPGEQRLDAKPGSTFPFLKRLQNPLSTLAESR